MAEAVEVAIEYALLTQAQAFATAQSLTISLPNTTFTQPTASPTAKWLRATFLPADSLTLGLTAASSKRHYGLFQMDVFYGQGSGELAPARIASLIIAYFAMGTQLTKDGFTVTIPRQPYRGQMIKDDPWQMIPVRIPYHCYA
jgi:hypothetical protein